MVDVFPRQYTRRGSKLVTIRTPRFSPSFARSFNNSPPRPSPLPSARYVTLLHRVDENFIRVSSFASCSVRLLRCVYDVPGPGPGGPGGGGRGLARRVPEVAEMIEVTSPSHVDYFHRQALF